MCCLSSIGYEYGEFDDVGSSLFPLVFPQAFDVAVKVIWPEGVHGLDSGCVVFAHYGLFWFKVLEGLFRLKLRNCNHACDGHADHHHD